MKKSNKRKPLISALEPRILFDGAALTTAVDVLDNNSYDSNTSTLDSVTKNDATSNTQEAPAIQSFERDRKEIAFVDTNVEDYQTLVDGIDSNTDVYLVESFNDISNILENLNDIDSIHILSHGSTGEITIGNDILNQDTLSSYEEVLNSIKTSLNESADILLYGCNVASDSSAENFISELSNITSADIAASDDITGNSALNGDWDLEYKKGEIESNEIEVLDFTNKLTAITISNANDQNYIERETINLAPTISYSDGGFYDKGYLLIEPQGLPNSSETLTITSSTSPNNAGEISVDGNKVYVGEGGSKRVIGIIDTTLDGTNGKALRIDFINPLPNGDFDDGTTNGWTIDNNFGGLTGDTHSNGLFGPVVGTSSVVSKDGRTVLQLSISGTVGEAYGTGHSPELVSSSFEATAGDTLAFDWKAERGGDYYDIVAFIKDNNTGQMTKLLEQRGEYSEWSSIEATIPYTSDDLEFIFYGGSYDATGGTYINSTFWIDNVAVYSRTVTDAMVTQITRQVEYTNDSYNPDATRDFKVSVENYDGITQDDTLRLNIIPIDQAPVAQNLTEISTDEDTTKNFEKAAFDINIFDDDNSPNYSKVRITTETAHGTLKVGTTVINSGDYIDSSDLDSLTYTPDANWFGTETFTWQALSNGLLSNEATATIEVSSVDDPASLTLSPGLIKPDNTGANWLPVDSGLTLIDPDYGEAGKDNISKFYVYINNGKSGDELQLLNSVHGITGVFNQNNFFLELSTASSVTAQQMQDALRLVEFKTNSSDTTDRNIVFTAELPNGALQTGYILKDAGATMSFHDAVLAAQSYGGYLAVPNSLEEFNQIATVVGSNAAYIGFGVSSERISYGYNYSYDSDTQTSKIEYSALDGTLIKEVLNYSTITMGSGYNFLDDVLADDYNHDTNNFSNYSSAIYNILSSNKLYKYSLGDTFTDWTGPKYHTALNDASLEFNFSSVESIRSVYNNPSAGTSDHSGHYWLDNPDYPNRDITYGSSNYVGKNIVSNTGGSTGTDWGPATGHSDETSYYYTTTNNVMTVNNVVNKYVVELQVFDNTTVPTHTLSGTKVADINASNSTPTILDINVDISEDKEASFTTNLINTAFQDSDGDSLVAIEISTIPSNGTLTLGGSIVSLNQTISQLELPYLKYMPNIDYNGSDSFTYKVTDGTSWSVSSSTVNLTINPINDAPTLPTATSTMTAIAEDSSGGSGQTINSFIQDTHLSDVDGAITSAIAVTQVDNTNGLWQYSLDGTTWIEFSSTINKPVTLTTPLLLDGSEYVRFTPNTNFDGSSTFKYRPWDKTSGTSGNTLDIFAAGSTTVGTRHSDIGTATVNITTENDAPVVTSFTNTLAPITEDETTYNTFSVAGFSRDKITDIDSSALNGIAVTSIPTTGNGTWQFTTDNGGTWNDITGVSTSNALLLKSNDMVRYVPNEVFGTTASLQWHAWDQSSGTAGSTVDITTNGGSTAFSTDSVVSTLNVSDVNDATVIAPSTLSISIEEDSELVFGIGEAQNISLSDVDTLSTLDYKLRLGAVHGKLTLGSLSNVTITDGADGTSNIQIQGKFTDIQNALEGLKYNPNAHYFSSFYGAEKIVIEVLDIGDTGTLSMISTKQIDITVTSVDDTPSIVEIGSDTVIENESLDASSQNISLSGSLTYDDADLESGDDVDITASYNNDIVWSGGTLDSSLATTLVNGFSFTNLNNETSSSNANWTYSASALDLDFLSKDETINFSYKFTVKDSSNLNSTKDITISIKGTNDVPSVDVSQNIDEELAFGNMYQKDISSLFRDIDFTDVFTYEVLNLPKGLSVDSNTGLISGKISSSGKFDVTLKATDTAGATAQRTFEMVVIAPPQSERPSEDAGKKRDTNTEDASKALTDKNNEIRKENGQEEIDKNKLLNDNVQQKETNKAKKDIDITRTELTTILNAAGNNPNDKYIKADLGVSLDDKGNVKFGEKSNEAFETVGLTIEKMGFVSNTLDIKIIDQKVGQKYSVTLLNGDSLPSTLSFDPNTGIISGTLPVGMEELGLSIKALSNDGTTRVLNLKIDINQLKEKNNEAKFKTLTEQIQAQSHKMSGYGDYISSLLDNSSIA